MKFRLLIILSCICGIAKAQQPELQYFRRNNKDGLNVFETTKTDTVKFDGLKVRLGGNFSQDFQGLTQNNTANAVNVNAVNTNQLTKLSNGFNLAMANLNVGVQLADGVRMDLTLYLSSRHHNETWVKGGYIQFDKLPFLKCAAIDSIMKNFTIKVGDYELDYGDQHYRRSDGGNTIYNPFVENYIMDEFATEIGGEVYFHPKGGFIAMAGITNGQLNPTVIQATAINASTGKVNKYAPAFHGKIGYDKQVNKDLRVRLTGSVYEVKSAASNSLFNGDRTGSRYFFAMENTAATSADHPFSGRFNPGYAGEVTTFMVNPFIKFHGLEFFGTYEMAKGRKVAEATTRNTTQYAADLIYRFTARNENFWVGGRYNTVTSQLTLNAADVSIERMVGSVGWFATKNIMLKAEYVSQKYNKFLASDIRSGGKFDGVMVEAVVAF
ncbi:MAG: hypothetical protein V4543_09760 [Bacteroidota bacterium]